MKKPWFKWIVSGFVSLVVLTTAFVAFRGYRMADIARDFEAQVRYMIESGGTIGAAPANAAFADFYLEAIFGDNPELLEQLRGVVRRGLEEEPDLNLGEVAAMIVTYRQEDGGEITDVAAHVVGGFPLGRMSPQFHRHGFFRHQIDENLWNMGNTMLRFLGRDMVLFADETVAENQTEIIEGVLQGNIIPLVNSLEKPIYYTAVLPDPRRVVTPQLRHHVQAVVMRGMLAPYEGRTEVILLTTTPRSATYTLSVMSDLKRMAEIGLKTKFKGIEQQTPWGPMVNPWWSYEMAETSKDATFEREENIVRMRAEYERVMVNAVLKTLERFGRDWRAMRLTHEERMDPREVDRLMATRKPLHYWSDEHRWGPDWPIGPSPAEIEQREREEAAREAAREARVAERDAARAERAAEQSAARAQRARDTGEPDPTLDTAARDAAAEADVARERARQMREAAEQAAQAAETQ